MVKMPDADTDRRLVSAQQSSGVSGFTPVTVNLPSRQKVKG